MSLATFGHHPNASTDLCCEIDLLEGWIEDMRAGLRSQWPFWGRLSRLLRFVRTADLSCLDEIAHRAVAVIETLEPRAIGALQ